MRQGQPKHAPPSPSESSDVVGACFRPRAFEERPGRAASLQPDSCQAAARGIADPTAGRVLVSPQPGKPTLRVAYLYSGESRKSSVAEELKILCEKSGAGLEVHEVDILNGGSEHNLLDTEAQARWESRIADGEFDVVIVTPPCSSWTRSLFRPGGPPPVRDKRHPWGLPNATNAIRSRAKQGNEFIHFAIRAASAAHRAKASGATCRLLLEHPEDLGRSKHGTPASIWQLPEIRAILKMCPDFFTVAGHQCQFGVDYSKPTRLLTDISGLAAFGVKGWPVMDSNDWYVGPLPRCGHVHKEPTVGQKQDGSGFHSSAKANYPQKMCAFIALHIFEDWFPRACAPSGGGGTTSSRTARGVNTEVEPSVSSRPGALRKGAPPRDRPRIAWAPQLSLPLPPYSQASPVSGTSAPCAKRARRVNRNLVFTPAGTCEQETPLIEDSALSFEDVVPISEGVEALDLKRFVVDEDQPPPNSADPGRTPQTRSESWGECLAPSTARGGGGRARPSPRARRASRVPSLTEGASRHLAGGPSTVDASPATLPWTGSRGYWWKVCSDANPPSRRAPSSTNSCDWRAAAGTVPPFR